ncbi:hypothetical protein MHB54_27850 [Paenibacillus sp. FSL M7-0802]|uniref:hypothetical protein n=1 Tax=Paenibacillus sp. FSL M7-0802 TaxID=2921536 RepID=UPI0030FB5FA3
MKDLKLQTVSANGEVLEESSIKVEEGNIITQRIPEGVNNKVAQEQHRFLYDALNNMSKKVKNNIIFYAEVSKTGNKSESVTLTLHKIDLDKGNSFIPAKTAAYTLYNLADFILDKVRIDKPKQIAFEGAGLSIGLKDQFFGMVKQREDITINEKGQLFYDGLFGQIAPQLYVGSNKIDMPDHVKYNINVENDLLQFEITNKNTGKSVKAAFILHKEDKATVNAIQAAIDMIK